MGQLKLKSAQIWKILKFSSITEKTEIIALICNLETKYYKPIKPKKKLKIMSIKTCDYMYVDKMGQGCAEQKSSE